MLFTIHTYIRPYVIYVYVKVVNFGSPLAQSVFERLSPGESVRKRLGDLQRKGSKYVMRLASDGLFKDID